MSITLRGGTTKLETEVMVDRITRAGDAPLQKLVDVWAMRSPQGDFDAHLALLTYVRLWFEARDATEAKEEEIKPELYREIVVTAVMTGITHKEGMVHITDKQEVDSRIIPGSANELSDIHMKKAGFKSHR